MAATDIKNLEKLVKEILEKVKGIEESSSEEYNEALEKINDKLVGLEEKISENANAEKASEEIINRFEEIKDRLEKQSDEFLKEFKAKIDKYSENADTGLSEPYSNVSDNIKDFVSIITNEMMELKAQFEKFNTEFTDISLNTNMAISKEVVSMKNCMLSLNDTIDSIKAKLENYNLEEVLPPVISTKVTENVSKDMNDLISSYLNSFKNEVFGLLAKISDGITAVLNNAKILEGLEVSIGEIIQNQQKNKDDILKIIKTNIADENKKMLPQILQMINGVSFESSAEEIKDGLFAINENIGIVNKNIANSAQVSEHINKQFFTVNKNITNSQTNIIDVVQNDVVSKIEKINKNVNTITKDLFNQTKSIENLSQADMLNKINKINKSIETLSQVEILDKLNKIDKSVEDLSQTDIFDKIQKIDNSISDLSKSEMLDKISKIGYTVNNLSGDIEKFDVINKIAKIDSVLDSVSEEFDIITKGSKVGNGEYFYTLLDLESDISKVRIILDELNNTIQDDRSLAESVTKNLSDKIANVNSFIEKTSKLYADPDYKTLLQQFDALNDDITSISKRTNKLILTSDDSAIKLQKNIEDFQNMMKKISATVENFENSNVLKVLVERTNIIQKLLKTSQQSDNAINEAFIYLATWIDNTSEQIEFIKNELSEIKEKSFEKDFSDIKKYIKDSSNTTITISNKNTEQMAAALSAIENNITSIELPDLDLSKIEKHIKEANKRFMENSSRIDNLDEKLDTLISQINVLNENIAINKANSKKIDKIEKQIQQLLSYVEEE